MRSRHLLDLSLIAAAVALVAWKIGPPPRPQPSICSLCAFPQAAPLPPTAADLQQLP